MFPTQKKVLTNNNIKNDIICRVFSENEKQAIEELSTQLLEVFKQNMHRDIVFVCIGTDRSTGDSLGPLVGMMLNNLISVSLNVYGTLDEPVHAKNLNDTMNKINFKYNNPLIIAIDACLGRYNNVGSITFNKGSLKPGEGVNKDLGTVGEYNIKGIVNVSGFMEYLVLQNTRLSIVVKMSKIIASSVYDSKKRLKRLSFEKK